LTTAVHASAAAPAVPRAQVVAYHTSWNILFFPLPFALLMIGVPLLFLRPAWNGAVPKAPVREDRG
jgi:hypothetical protein